jgi:hypothetical protein
MSISVPIPGLLPYEVSAIGRSIAGAANNAALLSILGSGTPSASNFLRGDGSWQAASTDLAPIVLGPNLVQQRNGTSPQQFQVFNTYTSDTSFETLDLRAGATQTAYEISSGVGSLGGSNRPINIGHRNSAGTLSTTLSVETNGRVIIGGDTAPNNAMDVRGSNLVAVFASWVSGGFGNGFAASRYRNASGDLYVGVDSSAGAGFGAAGNAGVLYTSFNTAIEMFTQATKRISIGGAGTVTVLTHLTVSGGTITGRASTTAAGTAPLKLNTGTLMTTPEAGAIEYDGTNLYFTDSGGTRRQLQVV